MSAKTVIIFCIQTLLIQLAFGQAIYPSSSFANSGVENAVAVGGAVANSGIGNGFGLVNSELGLANTGVNVANSGVGLGNRGVGLANSAIGLARNVGLGIANRGVGLAHNVANGGVGLANTGIGVAKHGVGIANSGVGFAHNVANGGVGVANSGLGVAKNAIGVANTNVANNAAVIATNVEAPARHGYLTLASLSGSGVLPVTSYSAIVPTGVSVLSDNAIEGQVAVDGKLPFLSSVAFEGSLGSEGHGSTSCGCGDGSIGIVSELSDNFASPVNGFGQGPAGLVGRF